MKKDDHYFTGSLLKTTGNKGEVILKFNSDLSDEILKLESILIEVDGKLVPFFIETIKVKSNTTVIVKFEDIDAEEKSTEFIDSEFYISKKQKTELKIDTSNYIDVTGYTVKDQNSKIVGSVIEFIDFAKNPLLNIKTETQEVLVPANEDLIIEVDDDARVILLNIPEGLIDLS